MRLRKKNGFLFQIALATQFLLTNKRESKSGVLIKVFTFSCTYIHLNPFKPVPIFIGSADKMKVSAIMENLISLLVVMVFIHLGPPITQHSIFI